MEVKDEDEEVPAESPQALKAAAAAAAAAVNAASCDDFEEEEEAEAAAAASAGSAVEASVPVKIFRKYSIVALWSKAAAARTASEVELLPFPPKLLLLIALPFEWCRLEEEDDSSCC